MTTTKGTDMKIGYKLTAEAFGPQELIRPGRLHWLLRPRARRPAQGLDPSV